MNSRHEHSHGATTTFEEELREHLRRAPWLLLSLAVHGVILFVFAQFSWLVDAGEEPSTQRLVMEAWRPIDPIEPPDQEAPEVREETVIEAPEKPLEEPIVSEDLTEEKPDDGRDEVDWLVQSPFNDTGGRNILGVDVGGPGLGGDKRSSRGTGKGGHQATQRAVEAGLNWLSRHQDAGGFWSCARFSDMCRTNACDGAGDPVYDVGVTGLALLAFLGAGHTPSRGAKSDVVRSGLKYLVSVQDPESGCCGAVNSHQQFLYDHAVATLALCEGYGLSSWPMLREPAQRGVDFIQAARNPYQAWRYAFPPDGGNDLSVTGWMVMALKSAQDFGLRVEPAALDGARLFIDQVTDESTWRAGYLARGSYSAREPGLNARWPETQTEALTAVAMLCRVFLGEDPENSPALRGGADLLLKQLPLWSEQEGTIDYYYWYYGSYAMWQMGGRDWERWEREMIEAVVKTQRRGSDEDGSWDPQYDPWGHRGGRVYSTALMTLCLEVFYRYSRVLGGR
ncbi:MAG: hypothetical protein HY812_11175 [Planctomycetes bacterium]|nr:hypothetical protein [Planctomycetota bacterium]